MKQYLSLISLLLMMFCCEQVLSAIISNDGPVNTKSNMPVTVSSKEDSNFETSCRQFLQVDSPQFLNSYWGKFFMSKGFQQILAVDYLKFYKEHAYRRILYGPASISLPRAVFTGPSARPKKFDLSDINHRTIALSKSAVIHDYTAVTFDSYTLRIAEIKKQTRNRFHRQIIENYLAAFKVPELTNLSATDRAVEAMNFHNRIHLGWMLIDKKDQQEAIQYAIELNKLSSEQLDILIDKFHIMSEQLVPLILNQARVYHLVVSTRKDPAAKRLHKSNSIKSQVIKGVTTSLGGGSLLYFATGLAMIDVAAMSLAVVPTVKYSGAALRSASQYFQLFRSKAKIDAQKKQLLLSASSGEISEQESWMNSLSSCLESKTPEFTIGGAQACSYRSAIDSYKAINDEELQIDANSSDDKILEFGTALQMAFFSISGEILPRIQYLKDPNRFVELLTALQGAAGDARKTVGEVIQELSPYIQSAIKDLSQSKDLKEIRKDLDQIGQLLNEAIVVGTDVYSTTTAHLDKNDPSWDKWELLETRLQGLKDTSQYVQNSRVVLAANVKALEDLRNQLLKFLSLLSSMAPEAQKKLSQVPALKQEILNISKGFEN